MDINKLVADYESVAGKKLSQSAREGLGYLLGSLAPTVLGVVATRRLAYMLATVEHEVGGTWQPIEERGQPAYFEKYETGRLASILGNLQPGDGVRFKGRGYCQITGRLNYRKFAKLLSIPLEEAPSLALVRDHAVSIMVMGMEKGLFTGVGLSKYIFMETSDYTNARRIINGDVVKNGAMIAHYAVRWEKILLF